MTTTTRNEEERFAESVCKSLDSVFDGGAPRVIWQEIRGDLSITLKKALAAERDRAYREASRATVERIRAKVTQGFAVVEDYDAIAAILDEEAAR